MNAQLSTFLYNGGLEGQMSSEKDKIRTKEWYAKNKEKRNSRIALERLSRRKEVIAHYTKGKMHCMCCGEMEWLFLTIEHLNGGGKKHRQEIGHNDICRWLKENNYPEGFTVLCMNCNIGKRMNGGICPHVKKE